VGIALGASIFFLAIPSVHLLALNALTECVSLFFVALLVLAISSLVEQFPQQLQYWNVAFVLFLAGLLTCIKPIFLLHVVLFSILLAGSYAWPRARRFMPHLSPPRTTLLLLVLSPVILESLVASWLTGTIILPGSGGYNLSTRLFPAVYGTAEGRGFVSYHDAAAERARQQYPAISSQIFYLAEHPSATVHTYFELLLRAHLQTGTIFAESPRSCVQDPLFAQRVSRFSYRLNYATVRLHAVCLVILGVLFAMRGFGPRLVSSVLLLGSAACLIVLSAPLTYWQGDRIILPAAPFWIALYSMLLSKPSRRDNHTMHDPNYPRGPKGK